MSDKHDSIEELPSAPAADLTHLSPSRELDAVIAEKVMGLDSVVYRTGKFADGRPWYSASFGLSDNQHNVPAYSTDISAAWSVLDKLQDEFGWELSDCRQPGLPYAASIYPISDLSGKDRDEQQSVIDQAYVLAETLPLAICKAALTAAPMRSRVLAAPSNQGPQAEEEKS